MQQPGMPVAIVDGVLVPQQGNDVLVVQGTTYQQQQVVQSIPVQTTYQQQQVQRQQMTRVGNRIDGLVGQQQFYAILAYPTAGDTNSMVAGGSCCCLCPPPCMIMYSGEIKLGRNEAMRVKYHNGVITMPDACGQRWQTDWDKVTAGTKIISLCCGFEGCCFNCASDSGK